MHLFLHINITPAPLMFFSENIPPVRDWVPDVSVFDLDNHSDALTIQTAVNAIQQAERIFLNIQAEPARELGGVIKIFNQLMKTAVPFTFFYTGTHPALDRMLSRLGDKRSKENEGLEKAVLHFFKG